MTSRILFPCLLALGLSAPAAAESPPPFPDFKAKRVTPPKPGQKKRITVQIEPTVPAVPVAPAPKAESGDADQPAIASSYAWFWEKVSPDLSASGPGRLRVALDALSAPPAGHGVAAPRLQVMQGLAQKHGIDILKATVGTQVSPALVLAVISVESGGRVDAVSSAGAAGLMQLMPATADRFGVADRVIPAENIKGGVAFLDFLMERFDTDPMLVLAGYNAGENAVTKHNGVPPFAETRDYVPKVLAAYKVARGLCRTPPQLISDGCVFVTP
ncbi:lytic transglycosylase domain-containing protein [Shimia sp. SDUM112013]|uniref:lytic transglycosylase domain-containing protein n=1 Tax=Shimia sp. SDUM112013 TaxID=3136160 RepID=UPI0032ED3995